MAAAVFLSICHLFLSLYNIVHLIILVFNLLFISGYFRELPGFGRYAVLGTDESGVFNLQINNATLGDEAVYECQVGPNGTNKPIRASAKLNVLCKFIISILHSVVCLLSIEQQINAQKTFECLYYFCNVLYEVITF